MLIVPADLVGPEEVKQQLAHWDEDRGNLVIYITSIFFAIAFTTVILRLAAKWKHRLRSKWDDYFIVTALILDLAVRFGAGIHSLKAGVPVIFKNLQVLFAFHLTYVFAHATIKTSILLLYKRVFTLNSQRFRYVWYAVLAYVISCGLMGVALTLSLCKPIQFFWEQLQGASGTCIDLKAAELGAGVALMAADVMILVLPMPMLWSLQVKWVRKIQLCALFGIGFVFNNVVAASIARIVCIAKVTSSADITFDEVNTLVLSFLEVDLGIVCACVPNLGPLFKRRNRQNRANFATPRSLLGDKLVDKSGLQWVRVKFDIFSESLTKAWRSRGERKLDSSRRGSASGEDPSFAVVEMHSLSEVSIASSSV